MAYDKDIDWAAIRLRFVQGETIYSIAKSLNGKPSKQAIMYRQRKEGWVKLESIENQYPVSVGNDIIAFQDERKTLVIGALSEGKSYKVAAANAGISEDTLKRWRDAEPEFQSVCLRAKANHLGRHETNISNAGDRGDWKASAYLLERDPLTKDQYKQQESVGAAIQINIGVDRDEVKIVSEG